MKYVSEIFNSTLKILSAIASALVYTVKVVNSFAGRQHLFDIAAIPIDVDSNFLSYPASSFQSQFRPPRSSSKSVHY